MQKPRDGSGSESDDEEPSVRVHHSHAALKQDLIWTNVTTANLKQLATANFITDVTPVGKRVFQLLEPIFFVLVQYNHIICTSSQADFLFFLITDSAHNAPCSVFARNLQYVKTRWPSMSFLTDMAMEPMPPAAPVIKTVSPFCKFPRWMSPWKAVAYPTKNAEASKWESFGGFLKTCRSEQTF